MRLQSVIAGSFRLQLVSNLVSNLERVNLVYRFAPAPAKGRAAASGVRSPRRRASPMLLLIEPFEYPLFDLHQFIKVAVINQSFERYVRP